jgi:two-component system sensor kinase FixL
MNNQHTPQSGDRRKTLEAIHDSAVDAIITINHRGLIETINPSTETLFGYTESELIGQNIKMLMPEPYHGEHDEYLQRYLQTGDAKIIGIGREVVARKKDGSAFPIHLAVSEVRLEGRMVFAGFVRDLTQSKMMEEQRRTLGRIIEDSRNEVYVFDAESLKFIQVNRGARENLGYSMDELTQLTPLDLHPADTLERFHEEVLRQLNEGQSDAINFTTIHRRKDGSTYDVDAYFQKATYLNRPAYVAIILDITERLKQQRVIEHHQRSMQQELERQVKLRTEELREAQAELIRSEKYSTLGKVAGGIAHEIRNPLNAVKTSAYYLLNAKNPPQPKVTEHLERIDRQVTAIDNVITALSDVAKMPQANLIPIAMGPLLHSVVGSTNLPSNVRTEFNFPDGLPKVLADDHQIVIAFRNLIRNARDAMPDGGLITIGAAIDDEMIVFSITDNGVGISKENLGRILEPLFTTKARGMGLGLAITSAIVEKNGGKLSVESELGKGSTFRISLKAAD